ncbi:MAG: molecular chaperone TorD family protein [Caldilineaceae bacterium]|nr:molecular chaperone TorD family protein [Caldilineaceae bacterium]
MTEFNSNSLSNREIAQARSRAYHLLSQLWLNGLTPALYEHVRSIPALAAALQESTLQESTLQESALAPALSRTPSSAPFDADSAAAMHQHLFGFSLFPIQSLFLARDGLVGGDESNRVHESYLSFGFMPPSDHAPDHLGVELAALALLTGAEADAWRDGLDATAAHMAGVQQTLLQQHLARWIAPITIAVEQSGSAFYAQVATLTYAVVSDHLTPGIAFPFQRPAETLQLDDPGTGLREIARWLLTPCDSGMVLTRDNLRALARTLDLPTGFGERQLMLVNLLRAAAGYDLLPALVDELRRLATAWQQAYAARLHAAPELITPWSTQVAAAVRVLSELHALATQELQELIARDDETA